MSKSIIIYWFRQDLRLADNPALFAAAQKGSVVPVYILDDDNAGRYKMGAANRWWLHHSLTDLNKNLRRKLCVFKGDACKIIKKLIKEHNVDAIYWNRCYEPWRIQRDNKIKLLLEKHNIKVVSFNGSLLWEPLDALKSDGSFYKVFTPFYRNACTRARPPRQPLAEPETLRIADSRPDSITIADLGLLPETGWDKKLKPHWRIGEESAWNRLQDFIDEGLAGYSQGRNFPAENHVSRLSPHLHFGEISPNQIWWETKYTMAGQDVDRFLTELGWREFCYSLLYHYPKLPEKNIQPLFDKFPWKKSKKMLLRWQQGMTGYPIVDAGMRELWQTGYMHNRVRMIVGSFLAKNLLLHWRQGEAWFRDCLVDADLASNSAGWQWIAGCGVDAAPYFRIFNPVTQGQKFDPDGEYTRKYVPELEHMPDKYLFNPWDAPETVLAEAGVKLGDDYPEPAVDLKASRERALQAYHSLKS